MKQASYVVCIHELGEDNEELLRYLGQNEFKPGTPFTVKQVLPFNQTMELETPHGSLTLGQAIIVPIRRKSLRNAHTRV